jgi:enoyl-CoA hydratase/carnithine racemase
MSGPVAVERVGATAWCTLVRPPLNLFDPTLIEALREAFQALAQDRAIRVAVLTGSGRAFTAGMDLHVLQRLDAAGARALIVSLHEAIEAVHHAPFPVVAAVNGPSLGAGFELALACDLRVATATAVFGLPEVRVGVPSVIEAALLPPLVGPGRAAELLLTGEAIGAEQALAWGLVNRVVAPADLRAAAQSIVDAILGAGPTAIRLQKALMLRWRHTDLASAIRVGIDAFAEAYATGEPAEGARAYLEKRPPRFDQAGVSRP